MKLNAFEIELDGRRVLIDRSTQEVCVLDESGAEIYRLRIQVAAGSVQGVFSSLHEVTDTITAGAPRRNA